LADFDRSRLYRFPCLPEFPRFKFLADIFQCRRIREHLPGKEGRRPGNRIEKDQGSVMVELNKKNLLVLILGLALLSSLCGWGITFRSVTKERDSLRMALDKVTKHEMTESIPVQVGKEIRYITRTVKDTETIHDVQTVEKTKTVTIEKRSSSWLGLGFNLCRPEEVKLVVGYMFLPVLGIQVEPFADLPTFRDPGVFVTAIYRP
jgi:hypothetical protein